MSLGVPGGLLFYRYEPFIRGFFGELGVDVRYSVQADKEILALGQEVCVSEACLPVKLFCGHVAALQRECERVLVPRIMNCEYGMELCPKIKGLPELVTGGAAHEVGLKCGAPRQVVHRVGEEQPQTMNGLEQRRVAAAGAACGGAGSDDGAACGGAGTVVSTGPLHMNDRRLLKKELEREVRRLGISERKVAAAMEAGAAVKAGAAMNVGTAMAAGVAKGVGAAIKAGVAMDVGAAMKAGAAMNVGAAMAAGVAAQWRDRCRWSDPGQYRRRVALIGHPYNLYDSFANLDLIRKLHRLDIGVVTGEGVPWQRKMACCGSLIKQPYWGAFVENYGTAVSLWEERAVDGIVFVSSFCCGTDSFTVDMIRARLENAPLLVLKVDEHRGEAGMDTRLQAFAEVLERRGGHAYVSAFR